MRRWVVLPVVAVLLVLPSWPALAASPYHPADGRHGGTGASAARSATRPPAQFAPLAARLGGSATVSGTIYDAAHVACGNAWVLASATTKTVPDGWWISMVWTDACPDGTFQLEVPAGWDTWLYANPGFERSFGRTDVPWEDGKLYAERDFYPGRLPVVVHRGGPWRDFGAVHVGVRSSTRHSEDSFATIGTKATPAQGVVEVLDGSYVEGFARFFWDEGLEFRGSWEVTSGVTSATGVTLDEAEAQRIWITRPYWHSGRPGAVVDVAFDNYPAGWVNWMGYDSDGPGAVIGNYGEFTSKGVETDTASFRVPAKAEPGFTCWIEARHYNGQALLELRTPYQVCTMAPSKKVVRRGARIRVTGVVPTGGRIYDIVPGARKTVTLYAHEGSAPVPTQWDPTGAGWVEVCTVKTNGYGVYETPYFAPPRTETLVVRYPGDDEYFDAYTSTARVTVR